MVVELVGLALIAAVAVVGGCFMYLKTHMYENTHAQRFPAISVAVLQMLLSDVAEVGKGDARSPFVGLCTQRTIVPVITNPSAILIYCTCWTEAPPKDS